MAAQQHIDYPGMTVERSYTAVSRESSAAIIDSQSSEAEEKAVTSPQPNRHQIRTLKAVILMGGPKQGTRFRPLNQPHCPKPLFPVAGVPLVYHQMEAAASVPGMKEIILIGSFHDERKILREFAQSSSASLQIPVRYFEEGDEPLGTAGSIYKYRDAVCRGSPDAFFVMHCDICADLPLQAMIDFHASVGDGSHMTIMSTHAKRGEASNYGCLVADDAGLVHHYVEKPQSYVSNRINAGVYLLSPKLFDDMEAVRLFKLDEHVPGADHISLEHEIVVPMTQKGRVYMFNTKSFWTQIKTAASTIYANRHYLAVLRRTRPDLLAQPDDGFQVVGDVRVDATAEIDATAKLGPNVSIGPNVRIGPGARIKDAIILGNVVIGAHCFVLNSIIDRGSRVGAWSRVEGAPVAASPDDPATSVPSKPLFNSDGRLEPSITIVGEDVSIENEIMVLNSVVLPHKSLTFSYKNEIIL